MAWVKKRTRAAEQMQIQIQQVIEERVQDLQTLLEALMAEREFQIGEQIELRLRDIVREASGYADEGLQTLSEGLRALGIETARRQQASNQLQREIKNIAEFTNQLRNVESRIEFVRREVLYELQAGLLREGHVDKNVSKPIVPRVTDPMKLEKSRDESLRLNVGCGHIPLDGYLNVDRRDLPGVDIVAEATAIPVERGSVYEIISSHLVEHFSEHLLNNVLLPYWHSLLKPAGRLVTIAPDGDAMLKAVGDGEMSFGDFREVLFGAQDYEGDYHYNLLTPSTMKKSLQAAGFSNIEVEYVGRRNGKCFEFRVSCLKGLE